MVRHPEPLSSNITSPLGTALIPFVALDNTDARPLYEQLYRGLREQILAGRLPRGARLASTRVLASHLGVSRFTVVTALERLVAEGYLTTRVGSGTFITRNLPEHAMRPSGRRVATALVDGIPPAMSRRGRAVAAIPITGPRPEEPRAFQPRRAPLDVFPVRAWASIVRKLWKRGGYRFLEYGDPAGYAPLRSAIAEHIAVTRAVQCEARQVVITCGSQQAFDILFRLLLDPGDRAWIEEPGYLDVRAALVAAGAQLVPVPVDAYGIDVAAGRKAAGNARVAVVSPSHQYPAGVTMSAARRIELLHWARSSGAWIIEDDYDSYFRYAGRPMSALQGLDRASAHAPRVIYVGTFSKTVFPSLRLGFCVVPDALVDAVTNARAVADRNSPIIDQAALTEFMTSGAYDRHLRRMRIVCQERYRTIRNNFERVFGETIQLSPASAGTHVIARLRPPFATKEFVRRLCAAAAREELVVFPLSRYRLTATKDDALVLGFGGLSPRRIAAGVEKLSALFQQLRKGAG